MMLIATGALLVAGSGIANAHGYGNRGFGVSLNFGNSGYRNFNRGYSTGYRGYSNFAPQYRTSRSYYSGPTYRSYAPTYGYGGGYGGFGNVGYGGCGYR